MTATTLYELSVNDKRNQPYDLAALKGKVVVVVNVASKCGFTPQYKGLEALYQKYKDQGLVILGFPCDQFGGQAPGSAEEEASTCQLNFGVTFPILEKIEVNGDNAHPVYVWLKSQKSGLLGLKRIKWNFEKFVVDKEGRVVERYASTTEPASLEKTIEKLLA
ncbi:thioredoxin-like protein [Fimicolochytrium jonesii]|uniref:thioredoxin-like protein n=1 Tax=Fimicolochytrium jonesii TaxID=1396493 RepID=UPI0022FEBFF6|nr:thioredoxin-like protein [Fimicolochytrium jonesii]KAI8825770.1 thioredoxin-like protein [Fimicolochytrium jonesii]